MVHSPPDFIDPPPAPQRVYRTTLIGTGVCGLAAVVSLVAATTGATGPGVLSSVRLLLVAVGGVTVAAGLSGRGDLPRAWLIAAAAALLAHFGLPDHWDSIRLLFRVLAGLAIAAAGLAAVAEVVRYVAISMFVLFHFSAIFLATTWPEPTPWLTQQVGTRVHLPYITFMYLKNAYHFYSPEPGPASHLFCLVTYDKPDEKTGKPAADWVTLPSRRHDWKDPLGLTYYRRLSITEQVANVFPLTSQTEEKKEMEARRAAVSQTEAVGRDAIPSDASEGIPYRMPRPDVTRYLLPSYAAHILHTYNRPDRPVKTVKIYRLEHQVLSVAGLTQAKINPHHAITFKPFYYGEFALTPDGDADLVDPQDPMLYWHVPLIPKAVPPGAPAGTRDFDDYLSKHAKYQFHWEARTP